MRRRDPNQLRAPTHAYANGGRRRARRAGEVGGANEANEADGGGADVDGAGLALPRAQGCALLLIVAGALAAMGLWARDGAVLLLILFWVFVLAFLPVLLFCWVVSASRHEYATPPGRAFGVLMAWLWKGWVVWAVFSLTSFNMLGVLMLPLLALVGPDRYTPFVPFMAPPFACALLATVACYLALRRPLTACGLRPALPFAFNALMIGALLLCAEQYRAMLVTRDLATHHPACVSTESFWSSVKAGWEEYQFHTHGAMVEDGVTYLWSYKERRFVAVPGLQGYGCTPP